MKREFLQQIRVEGQPLPKEVVDAIMAQNGRDIENVRQGYSDYEDLKQRLQEALDRQADSQVLAQQAKDWEERYHAALAEQAERAFRQDLEGAIEKAGGRSVKAVCALLDLEALQAGGDIPAALEALRKDHGYLFDDGATPPPYAGGTGGPALPSDRPESLAGALRERYGWK